MTAWLSGGLSQFSSITDQISTFTKDVLSETTEEIEDPAAELQVARRKIQQLEEVNTHYKTEWEKLQKHSEEVRERAETSECQIAAISREYRKLIHEKDAELRRLRTETASLKEQQRKMVSGGGSGPQESASPLTQLARGRAFFSEESVGGRGEWEVAELEPVVMGGGGKEGGREEGDGGGGWGEYHDFGDVISSQGEINRLQMELTRLRAESRHWKALAEEKGHSTNTLTSGPVETELASLREQIEELQLCLQRERTQHQYQLSSREAAHHDKLCNLSSHTQSLTTTKETSRKEGGASIEVQLQEAIGGGGGEGGGPRADETIRVSLLPALEEVSLEEMDGGGGGGRERNNDGELTVASLQSQLVESHEKCLKFESEFKEMALEVNRLCEERREGVERERVTVEALRAEVDSLNTQLKSLQQERVAAEGATREEAGRLRGEVGRLEEENRELRAGRDGLERQLGEAESASQELRGQLQCVVNEKPEVEMRAKELADTLDTQKEAAGQLQSEVEHLKRQFLQERDTYTRHVEQEKAQLTSVVAELQSNISQHEAIISSLRAQCQQSQNDAETLSLQVDQLVAEREGRDRQLEQLLQREQSSEKSEREEVGEELQGSNAAIVESLRKANAEMEESLKWVNAEKEECVKRVNEEMEVRIRRVISEKEELARELNSRLSAVKLQKQELETHVDNLTAEDKSLREQMKQLEMRLQVENEALVRAEFEANAVKKELKTSEERQSQLDCLLLEKESRIAKLETEAEEVREKMSQLATDHAGIEAKLQEKEMLIEHGEKNLREVGRLLASREQEIATLQRERNDGSSATDDGGGDQVVSGALENLTRERDELLVQVRTTRSEVQSLRSNLTESHRTLESVNCKLQEVNTRNLELQQAVEAARSEAGGVRSERVRWEGRVREVEEEAGRTREELAAKETECGKLVRQLEHLKAHMVQVEEQYTQDALRAAERERGERKRAEELQETLRHSSYIDQQENLQREARVGDLEEQLHVLASQRDAAILELSSAREEAQASAAALSNLQSVLEQFQRDHSSELNEALKRSQLELANTLCELNTLKTTFTTAQSRLSEARATEDLLCQQLKEREKRAEDLQQEVTRLGGSLRSTEEALERLMREQGGRVDQNLVKNLVVGYVQAPDRKKPEVLNLIAKILDFSPSEVQQVQSRRSGGWLGGLWGGPSSPVTRSPKLPVQGASLSQLFVSFLETESLPTSLSTSLPLISRQTPPLAPPPSGRRVPEPDSDRPSRATTGLAPTGVPPAPPSQRPSILSQSITPPTIGPTHNTSSSHPYADTHSLPDSGTTRGPLSLSVPPSSLTTGLHLSPITPSLLPTHTTTSDTLGPVAVNPTATTPPRYQQHSHTTTSGFQHFSHHQHQSSILKDLLSPPTS